MENWPKETVAQLRERIWRALVQTGIHDATPEERAALLPAIRDFRDRQRRQKAAERSLRLRIAIMAVIATVVVGGASIAAVLFASHNAPPIVIQAPPPSFTPYPVATPTVSPH